MSERTACTGASLRLACIAAAFVPILIAACSHRDPPACFGEGSGPSHYSAAERSALEDARRREGPCEIRCSYGVAELSSGELLVSVGHASLDESGTKCIVVVGSDHHYLYSGDGEFKELMRVP